MGNMSGRNPGAKSPSNRGTNHAQDPQDNIDIDVGNDDYDEETDEFANYSHQQQMHNNGSSGYGDGAHEIGQGGTSGSAQSHGSGQGNPSSQMNP